MVAPMSSMTSARAGVVQAANQATSAGCVKPIAEPASTHRGKADVARSRTVSTTESEADSHTTESLRLRPHCSSCRDSERAALRCGNTDERATTSGRGGRRASGALCLRVPAEAKPCSARGRTAETPTSAMSPGKQNYRSERTCDSHALCWPQFAMALSQLHLAPPAAGGALPRRAAGAARFRFTPPAACTASCRRRSAARRVQAHSAASVSETAELVSEAGGE